MLGYICVSDRYCPTDDDVFSSVEEFQHMCWVVFGERAELAARGVNYEDERGAVVLRPVTTSFPGP
jgi:hypothetical protein